MEDKLFCLIKDFGFPIVMCLLLWYQGNTTINQNTKVLSEIRDYLMFGKTYKKVE